MLSVLQFAVLRRLFRARERLREPDWGDMGTAFGLDQSLDAANGADAGDSGPPVSVDPAGPGALWRNGPGRKSGC
jgi:hypothetical protein